MPAEVIVSEARSRKQVGKLADIANRASQFVNQSKAGSTIRAYLSDWQHFSKWCASNSQSSLPALPDTVALYLTDLASTHKPATLTRRMAAISQAHQIAGLESPTRASKVRLVMAGIRRNKGTAQTTKTPVVVDDLRKIVAQLPESLSGMRDRVLLLIGFTGAFRRSELVALDRSDVEFTREGLVISIRRSKTDQEGEGRKIGIPYGSNPDTCPIRSLQEWLEQAGIDDGPVFRPINRHGRMALTRLSAAGVAEVVKKYAEAVGLNPRLYAGHSLRSGLATAAASAGASERAIMNQTGHRSLTTVRRYIRTGSLFRENAAAALGL